MRQLSITPNITVTIGRHTRIYFAFAQPHPAAHRHVRLHAHRSPQVQRATAVPVHPQEVFSH